jgi:hypothetical protein
LKDEAVKEEGISNLRHVLRMLSKYLGNSYAETSTRSHFFLQGILNWYTNDPSYHRIHLIGLSTSP